MGSLDERFTDVTGGYMYNWPQYRSMVCAGTKPPMPGVYSTRTHYESVDSYRGKPTYVDVGTKRRKTFHPFRRVHWRRLSNCEGWVCHSTPSGLYFGWAELFPYADIYLRMGPPNWESLKGSTWSGDPMPVFEHPLSDLGAKYRDFVIRDMYSKLNDPRFNVAVFLAELDETIVGIHGLFKGCLSSLLKTRVASKNIKHLILNPEELWLWWRYMLMPTMMDVEDLIEVATKKVAKIDRVQDGDSYDEPSHESGTLNLLGYGWGHVDIPCEWKADIMVGSGGALDVLMRYDPSPWGTSSWDVLMATWERIPFSFIMDWFVNIGDWLASLRDIEYQLAQSYATYAIDSTVDIISAEPYTLVGDLRIRSYVMDRITGVEPPKLPLVDKRWRNTIRTIDLISLSIGMLKSVLKRRK